MGTEVSRACSKALAIVSYPEPDEFSSLIPIMSVRTVLLLSDHLLLGLPSGIFSSGFPGQNPLYNLSSLPVCQSYVPLFYNPNYILQRVQIMKMLIIQFSPAFCYFLLAPNILSSALSSHPQVCVVPSV